MQYRDNIGKNTIFKKSLVLGIILLAIIAVIIPSINGNIISTVYNSEINMQNSSTSLETKKWTWIFYNDLDYYPTSSLGYDRMEEFAKEAYSAENLDVIVLEDRYDGPANIWYINSQHNKEPLEELGEVNMSDYKTLRDFLKYGKERFPAERYLLSIGDHGGGWKGACIDETNNSSFLSMDGFQKALDEAGGVDVLCFTHCSMSAIESAYELRNCTEIYIGNQDSGGYSYWRFMTGDLCTLLNENPDISNVELGKEIIKLIKKNFIKIFLHKYPNISREEKNGALKLLGVLISMSAIDTSKLDKVCRSVDKLAKDLISTLDNDNFNLFRIKLIYKLTQSFPPKFFKLLKKDKLIFTLDLYDFSKKCYTFFYFNNSIRLDAKEVMNSIDEAVIAIFRNIFHPRAHGLTVYFPPDIDNYNTNYTTSDLDFLNDTYWDEFLEIYLI